MTLKVNINGLPQEIQQKIADSLLIYQAQTEPKITQERIMYLYDNTLVKLPSYLEGLGYYHTTIESSLRENNNNWCAQYNIKLNDPTTLKTVSIIIVGEGQKEVNLTKTHYPLKQGSILTQEDYERSKNIILTAVHSQGYLRARFIDPQLIIDKQRHSADVKLVIETGQRYHFGKITFVEPPYRLSFLQRFILWKEGEIYNAHKVIKLQEDFANSDMFAKIRIVPSPNLDKTDDLSVPIEIRLYPKNPNRYTGSIGAGTDEGIRITAGWQHRRKNTDGHKINIGSRFSKVRKHAYCNYTIPGKRPAYDKYLFSNNFLQDSIRDEYSKRGNFYFSKGNRYSKLYQDIGVRYLVEKFRFSKDEAMDSKKLLLPNVKWTFVTHTSLKVDPNSWERGIKVELGLSAGVNAIVGSSNMFMSDFLIKGIQPFGDNWRIIGLGQVSSIMTKNFQDIPLSLRHFAGGDRSVRGFGYRTLGPTKVDVSGNTVVIGGEKMLLGTIELERRFIPNLSMAVFYDIGNAINNWKDKLAAGVGIGVRYGTQLGALRFDIAKPIKEKRKDKIRLHLTFGKDL